MTAYYNEHDPAKAVALQAMMDAGHITPGVIDTKDIRDVAPDELSRFTQCHFFAGIGLWSAAARAAGIDDDFPFWSGSCPCQPYSAAGAGGGLADDRHLWPHWFWLIAQCRPHTVVGEQVASKDGLGWFDIVSADMEGSDYAGGRSIFAVRASARRTSVNGSICAGWSTPSARDWKDTPGMATQAENPDGSERLRLDQLPRQAMLAGWGTLIKNDAEKRGQIAPGNGLPSETQSASIGNYAIRCTIAQTASGMTLTGSCVETLTDQNSGLLDPAHSSWLQGIPAEITSCVRTAMQSISKSRRRSSKA